MQNDLKKHILILVTAYFTAIFFLQNQSEALHVFYFYPGLLLFSYFKNNLSSQYRSFFLFMELFTAYWAVVGLGVFTHIDLKREAEVSLNLLISLVFTTVLTNIVLKNEKKEKTKSF